MQRLVTLIAILLGLAILSVPAYILALTWTEASAPDGLLTLNTKDSTRFDAPSCPPSSA